MARPRTGRRVRPKYRDMVNGRHFHRFMDEVLPVGRREEVAERADYDWHAHKLTFEKHFKAQVLRHFKGGSLNTMVYDMGHDPLYAAHGAKLEITAAGLSKAHARRPIEPYLNLLDDVLRRLAQRSAREKVLRDFDAVTLKSITHLLEQTRIFDATTLELPSKIARWAQTGKQSAGIKVQLRLAGGYGGLDRILLTPKPGNDSPYFLNLLDLKPEAGHIYLFDAGYFDLTTYQDIFDTGNHFVTVLHDNIQVEILVEQAVPEGRLANGYTVHHDWQVYIGSGKNRQPDVFRLLEVTDSRGKRLRLLTDRLTWTAEQVCQLNMYRWTVETVFRWLKSQLAIDQFISYSPNGVQMQVLVALIVYGLLVLYHEGGPLSLIRILRKVRVDLHQALYDLAYQQALRDAQAQLADQAPSPLPIS